MGRPDRGGQQCPEVIDTQSPVRCAGRMAESRPTGFTMTLAYFSSFFGQGCPKAHAAAGDDRSLLLGGDYARGEFELKDDPAGVAAGGGAQTRTLDFNFPSRSAPPSKQYPHPHSSRVGRRSDRLILSKQ